jgi:hypothetical protein
MRLACARIGDVQQTDQRRWQFGVAFGALGGGIVVRFRLTIVESIKLRYHCVHYRIDIRKHLRRIGQYIACDGYVPFGAAVRSALSH